MSFSENLKMIRKEKKLSQEELADLLNVSRQAVSKWELGEGYPEVEKLLLIAKELNVSLDSLMGSEIMTPAASTKDISGRIIISSPHEGTIITCSKVLRSPKYRGGKNTPKYALFAQDSKEKSFWAPVNTFLGWYMTEEDIEKEISNIYEAIINGEKNYELKFSVKVKRSFLSVSIDSD